MNEFLTNDEINQFNKDGAIFIKGKFDADWIEKLKKGIERDIKNPSPRFKSSYIEKRRSCLFRRLLDLGFST